MGRKKKADKRTQMRPTKRHIEPIPDTPENVAKALFGIKSDNKQRQKTKDV